MSKKTKSILTMVVGVVAIVLAIVCFAMDTGNYERDSAYGGDAYTGIQNAAAQTANNVQDLAAIAKVGFGSILMVFGLYLIVSAIDVVEVSTKSTVEAPKEPSSQVENIAGDEIGRYKELLDNGVISQEEFDAKKAQLLNLD